MLDKMRVLSVNLGGANAIPLKHGVVQSSIHKRPVSGRVWAGRLGLQGDARIEPRKMGAEHHAVYAYPHEHYHYWQQLLERPPFPLGQFGENLTVSGLLETELRIGDVLRIGSCLLQVSHHRIPCAKLDAHIGARLATRFLASGKTGIYLRVLEEGEMGAGDAIELVARDPNSPTVETFIRLLHYDYWDVQGLAQLLQARDLMPAWREEIEQKLRRARVEYGWPGLRELRISEREVLSEDSVSLTLSCRWGRSLPPLAGGQQLTVVLGGRSSGEQIRRVYPVIEASAEGAFYRITIQGLACVQQRHSECALSRQLLALSVGDYLLCAMPLRIS